MASLLALGGGASEGLDTYLTRLLQEQQVQQKQQQIAEEARSNQAHEALQGRQIDETGLLRQLQMSSQLQNQQNANADRDAARTLSAIKLRPIGANVTPEEKTGEMAAGASQGNYDFTPASLGQSTPEGDIGPTPDTIKWRGTQEQITAAANAAKEKGGEIRDTANGLQRVGADNQVSPILGPDGKPVQGYHPPAGDKLVKVEHRDPSTGRTVIEWLPQSEVRGQRFQKGASGATETRLASAQAVTQTGNDIIAQLSDPAVAAAVGPAMGRFSTLRDFIGNPPPEFSELAGSIESYAIANMGVHGMRSVQGAEQIKKLLDAHHTPESLKSTITGLNKFSQHFMENEGRGNAPQSPASPASPAAPPKKKTAAELLKQYGG